MMVEPKETRAVDREVVCLSDERIRVIFRMDMLSQTQVGYNSMYYMVLNVGTLVASCW
jgi:hypothetical protein